jgi:HD-GYP domain-containing protein (c-di-GMP phosphodiesterase class II)/pSer/pThr/pTyr-binding forkhead associated (FHA) protein
MTDEPTIFLRGIAGSALGHCFELVGTGRIGRLDILDVVLEHNSVSRQHAELRATENGWRLLDLGSTNGTYLNGKKLGFGQWPIRCKDVIKCGDIQLQVESISLPREILNQAGQDTGIIRLDTLQSPAWEGSILEVAGQISESPENQKRLMALLRAGSHLVTLGNESELLSNILEDAVATLNAQRGAIVLAEGDPVKLRVRAICEGKRKAGHLADYPRPMFSQSIARRCFETGESILCSKLEDFPSFMASQSVADGFMTSVLCVLLRTPRTRLGVLHLDRGPGQKPFTLDDHKLADALAAQVSIGIEASLMLKQQKTRFLEVIQTLAQIIEVRDDYTGGHTRRVTRYAEILAKALQLPREQIDLISLGTPLHDIGKIGVDDAILRKPGILTPAELAKMREHTTIGAQILGRIPDLAPLVPIARSHHERFDGHGYPDRLAGENIPQLARVVAVVDAFDAMTTDRPYRPAMDTEKAFAEVARLSGSQFDPKIANIFLSIRDKIELEWALQHGK